MNYTVRVRVHEVEVKYTLSGEPTRSDVLAVLTAAAEVHREAVASPPPPRAGKGAAGPSTGLGVTSTHSGTGLLTVGTVDNIINTLNMEVTGPNLITAAALYLALDRRQERFSRNELLAAAKGSNSFTTSMSKNATQSIKSVMRQGRLGEMATDQYAVSPTYLQEVETSLVQ